MSSNNNDLSNKEENFHQISRVIKKSTGNQVRIKPKFYKLMGQVMNLHIDQILNYLDLIDLAKTRSVNKLFLAIVHEYYPKRLRFEVDKIKTYQERNYESFLAFMKIIDSQIPVSLNNWLDFDLNSVIAKLKLMDKNVITNLRGIKNLGKISEVVYAPFCIIFGYNKKSHVNIKSEGWKKTAGKILTDPDFARKLNTLDLDNLNETDMLDAFVYLNLPELDLNVIRKYSSDLEKLLLWSQAVVSYHILIHPFTHRNDKSQLASGTDLYQFVRTMNKQLDRFYKFKRFLINLNIMNIPLAEYVFNLQHNREQIVEAPSLGKLLNEKQIGNILSYLHYNVSYKLMGVSKKWHEGFKKGADYIVQEILKEIFFLKLQARERLSKRIPVLFENDIFSDYFLMLDDILNLENCKEGSKDSSNFLSKEQLNDIKNIKIETDVIKSVAKVICIILGEKPDRKTLATGEIKTLYLEKLKMMVLNGQLTKLMKNVNKLDINLTKINTISEELSQYIPKLEEVKKTNRGVYQLLIWELMVYECLKTYNPFDFISSEYITNRFETDEVEIVKYYCEIMNYLKYNLKIKFKLCGSFQLKKLYDNLKKYLNEQKMSLDLVDDSNSELNKIAKIYFESKDIIPLGAKPALYERMFNEIIKISSKIIQDTPSSEASAIYNVQEEGLGVIKEENSVHGSNINLGRVMISPGHQSMNIQLNKSYQREMNKIQLLCNFKNKKSSSVTFSDIPQEVIIKHMLFYLDINSLPKFALCSKKTNETIKTHIFIRLFFLNKEKKLIEQENFDLIASVEEKRKRFFEEYEIDQPSKDHSCQLMNIITSDDIIELKQCFKKYNKNYENIISPLVLLLGGKASSCINPDGSKTVSYFYPAQKLLNSKDFIKRLRDMELETIPQGRFKAVEKIIESPNFNIDKIKQLSPCLYHLLSWIIGVIEFHRVIRKYSLSSYDYDILTEEEINFCSEMDNILLLYFKLMRYANRYCKKFEKMAQTIMTSMNISNK